MTTMSVPDAIASATAACSFILVGNAITQTFMSVPALLVDFPPPTPPANEKDASTTHPATQTTARAARARLLGRQWPVFWSTGNSFFRPLSTLGIFGYATAAAAASASDSRAWYALAAACHVVTVVHSAVNMQPLNEKLAALAKSEGVQGVEMAEETARKWIRGNYLRIVMPFVAGTVAMWQLLA